MYIIYSQSLDPFFNIASEEYLLRNYVDNLFLIYRNEPSIIIGKHQNALKEINYPIVKQNNIKVVRRITGGGAVYHDQGNLNYTFITAAETGKQVDFKKFTSPILNVLKKLGVHAIFSGKSDLIVGDKKFSGNAAHVFKNIVLHHGTILFNADLNQLRDALASDLSRFSDKSVESRRAEVTNIAPYIHGPIDILEFFEEIITQVTIDFNTDYERNFNPYEVNRIEELVKSKYGTWEWNFGYSPKYELHSTVNSVPISVEVKNGIIENIRIEKGHSNNKELEQVVSLLIHVPHRENNLHQALTEKVKSPVIAGLEIEELVKCFF